ncbi:nicotinate phosphoribosyltransferase-like [Rhopilema esculentum]|uniref:nicotinate phosphoribosyltransferase-like n=1 Tax=Rhopilema esculentum TaxID=499914 RepID=UPI0031CF8B93
MASTCSRKPQNGIVQAILTDLYQVSMAYAYWESGKRNEHSVFDLYFRTNPFQGEFTIFAGLHECISYLQNFKFTESDIEYLQNEVLPKTCKQEFFDYLRNLTTKDVTLYAIPEGTVVFPRVPLLRVEGPLPVAQLLETTLLNLVNYASLVATNAARFRIAAGKEKTLLEFGLRRAQGPDGALSASKYCYIGGFDGTSNVLAGKKYGIPCKGTQAHAFVSSFLDNDQHRVGKLTPKDGGEERELFPIAKNWLEKIAPVLDIPADQTSRSELIAFCAFAVAFPTNFLALVDTYNVIRSGLPNFCAVALALNDFGYKAVGIRLDSGDLSYLSQTVRQKFVNIGDFTKNEWFRKLLIVASNDLNEETIYSLQQQGHEIDSFGIGTHLVTCQKQPALGCVYKLVEINREARMKISEEVKKVTIPGHKDAYRLYGADGKALVDLVQTVQEPPPLPESRALCRHPIVESKRAYVKPSSVESLLKLYFKDGEVQQKMPSLHEIKDHVKKSLASIRVDHLRSLNPTPYKVSVSDSLYNFMHQLWLDHAPIGELS